MIEEFRILWNVSDDDKGDAPAAEITARGDTIDIIEAFGRLLLVTAGELFERDKGAAAYMLRRVADLLENDSKDIDLMKYN